MITKRWSGCLLLPALAVGLPAQQDAVAPRTPPLRFAWPVPGRASVTHQTAQSSTGGRARPARSLRKRFTLEVTADREERVLRLEQTAMEILEVNGRDASSPAIQRQLGPVVAQLMAAQPIVRVTTDGEFLGVEDWDAHVA